MKYLWIFTIFFLLAFNSHPNGEAQQSEIDLPKEVGQPNFLNCQREFLYPDTIASLFIGTDTLDSVLRNCLSQKLQEANDRLCHSKFTLEAMKKRAQETNNSMRVSRIESSLEELDELQNRFKENLKKLKEELQRRSGQSYTNIEAFDFIINDQLHSWGNILDAEAQMECPDFQAQ